MEQEQTLESQGQTRKDVAADRLLTIGIVILPVLLMGGGAVALNMGLAQAGKLLFFPDPFKWDAAVLHEERAYDREDQEQQRHCSGWISGIRFVYIGHGIL